IDVDVGNVVRSHPPHDRLRRTPTDRLNRDWKPQMPYEFTDEGRAVLESVRAFMDEHIYPNEAEYRRQHEEVGTHGYPPILDELKRAAHDAGLWNLFLPHLSPDAPGTKLSNLDYAPISEELGKVDFASEVLNCSAPDTGNMEILNLYGS